MKIALASDMHWEHYPHKPRFGLSDEFLNNSRNADVLLLAGDIMDYSVHINDRDKVLSVFSDLSINYENVIYVMGNHEHYGGDFTKTHSILSELLKDWSNIHVLEKQGVTIGDTRFFGGTMWTSVNNEDPIAMSRIHRAMNDYNWVSNSSNSVNYRVYDENGAVTFKTRPAKLSPEDTTSDHRQFLEQLSDDIEQNQDLKYCVVTHHSPSFQMCMDQYRGHYLNDAYMTDLEQFILDRCNIKKWVHGHLHNRKNVTIGECNIEVNARGYASEGISRTFELSFFDL